MCCSVAVKCPFKTCLWSALLKFIILPGSDSDVPQKSHTKSSKRSVSSKELDSDVHHSREKKGS